MAYDKNNVFAKIISGEIKEEKLYEDSELLAFKDINPEAKTHILVIPKGEFVDFGDFVNNAGSEKVAHYFSKIDEIAKSNGLEEYQLITNKGAGCGQTVFHFHTHILSERKK